MLPKTPSASERKICKRFLCRSGLGPRAGTALEMTFQPEVHDPPRMFPKNIVRARGKQSDAQRRLRSLLGRRSAGECLRSIERNSSDPLLVAEVPFLAAGMGLSRGVFERAGVPCCWLPCPFPKRRPLSLRAAGHNVVQQTSRQEPGRSSESAGNRMMGNRLDWNLERLFRGGSPGNVQLLSQCAGKPPRSSRWDGVANHIGPEPCVITCEGEG